MNGLSDREIIEALYEASGAGTRIDLIVRGICCLRPGMPGLSENIGVRSVLGRYLEHSRIFRFGSERRGRRYFVGSADLMPRNLDRRVEVLTPVEDTSLQRGLDDILDVNLSPQALVWMLLPDGTWRLTEPDEPVCSQLRFQQLAEERARAGGGP